MSATEYNNLLYAICRKLDELNALDQLLSMCRGKLAPGSEGNIRNTRSLCDKLEENNKLGIDRLQLMKRLLRGVEDWVLLEKVEKFECKRKEYKALLEKVISSLDALDDLERLIAICRGSVREGSEGNIEDVRSLFRELENQENLEIDYLDVVKNILAETESNELLKELEEFEKRRNREDKSEARRAQRAALMSSVRSTLVGVVNIKTVFKVVAGGLTVVSAMEVLSRWSSFDQLVTAVQTCVLPAGTRLVQITDGCVCLTVQAESLSALIILWKLYQDGTLQKHLHDFFVTNEVRELADGEDVEVNVTIDEDEYQKACLELMNGAQEVELTGREERTRRNSDSVLYPSVKEELSMLKIKRIQAAFNQRMTIIEKEIEEVSSKVFGDRSVKRQQTIFKKIPYELEETKAQELKETEEGLEGHRLWQPYKVEPVDMEKFSLVQKYLEDVHETRSVTTEASDSALGTQAAVSEIETEEISDRLCLRDLSQLVTGELNQRLEADATAIEKVSRFFGFKGDPFSFPFLPMEDFFPDTPVSVLKECFEALRLHDLAEILAKVKPRALCPALSPDQVEKLQLGDRRTKNYSKMAVVVVDVSSEKDTAKMIETFFKDLNPKNEVGVIPFTYLEKKYLVRENIERTKHLEMFAVAKENELRYCLEIQLPRLKKKIEGEGQEKSRSPEEESVRKVGGPPWNYSHHSRLRLKSLKNLKEEELFLRKQLDTKLEQITKLREEIKRETELIEDIERENSDAESTLLNVMDKWIQDQDGSTFFAVFLICPNHLAHNVFLKRLHKTIEEKLASISDLGKLVVSPPRWKSTSKIPETLHIILRETGYSRFQRRADNDSQLFTSFIEIFKKRWSSLDLTSIMREFKRTWPDNLEVMDNLSTLPRI